MPISVNSCPESANIDKFDPESAKVGPKSTGTGRFGPSLARNRQTSTTLVQNRPNLPPPPPGRRNDNYSGTLFVCFPGHLDAGLFCTCGSPLWLALRTGMVPPERRVATSNANFIRSSPSGAFAAAARIFSTCARATRAKPPRDRGHGQRRACGGSMQGGVRGMALGRRGPPEAFDPNLTVA